MPLPPPPPLSIPETEEGIVQTDKVNVGDKPASKHFFAPLKSKRKGSGNLVASRGELRPDVFVNNIVPADGNRLATIRKPHNPLKYPSNSNAASIDPEVNIFVKFKLQHLKHTELCGGSGFIAEYFD